MFLQQSKQTVKEWKSGRSFPLSLGNKEREPVAVSLRTFTNGREMAAWVKALLGRRAKDVAFLQAPSGGQKSKIPKKLRNTVIVFFPLKRL